MSEKSVLETGPGSSAGPVASSFEGLSKHSHADLRSSQEILRALTPPANQTFQERLSLLERYHAALQAPFNEVENPARQGARFGSEVNLTKLDPSVRTIIVGDLHGELASFKAILADNENLHEIANGRAVLMLLGDIVHPVRGNPQDMRESLELKSLVMALTVAYPHNVFSLVGNHDPFHEQCNKTFVRSNGEEITAEQNYDFKDHLDEVLLACGAQQEGWEHFCSRYEDTTRLSPYYFVADGVVGVHAGPITAHSRDTMRQCAPLDGVEEIGLFRIALERGRLKEPEHSVYHDACWRRWHRESAEDTQQAVSDFLQKCEQPNGHLIVGHSPSKVPNQWRYSLIQRKSEASQPSFEVIIASGKNILGYAVLQNKELTYNEIPLPQSA